MNILITGGAGFIGSHMAHHYLEKGDNVWVVDNLSTGKKTNLPLHENLTFDSSDLLSWDFLEKAVEWADGIYHFAAIVGMKRVLSHPVGVIQSNILGCQRILECMAKVNRKGRLLLASSSEVYNYTTSFKEDALISFPSGKYLQVNYGLSKAVNEAMCLSYKEEYDLDVVIARLFNTTGPNQTGRYGMVMPLFVKQALEGELLTVYGNGKQTRSFCDIRDTIYLLEGLFLKAPKGEIFNVGNDQEISIKDLAKLVIKELKSDSKLTYIPYKEAYGMDFQDLPKRRPDLSKLNALLHYPFQWTLSETIREIAKN